MKAGRSLPRLVKRLSVVAHPVRAGVGWFRRWRWVRRLATRRFRSGLVALGEQNGYVVPGRWITVDVADADFNVDLRALGRLPFLDASQDVIYSSHLIEHLDDEALGKLFADCRRILRPGGHVRFETVDAERFVHAYEARDAEFFEYFIAENQKNLVYGLGLSPAFLEPHNILVGAFSCYIETECQIGVLASKQEVDRQLAQGDLDEFGRWCASLQTPDQYGSGGHVNCLYLAKLERLLVEAGFREVGPRENGVTRIPGLDLRGIERPHRAFYSVYVEARK